MTSKHKITLENSIFWKRLGFTLCQLFSCPFVSKALSYSKLDYRSTGSYSCLMCDHPGTVLWGLLLSLRPVGELDSSQCSSF